VQVQGSAATQAVTHAQQQHKQADSSAAKKLPDLQSAVNLGSIGSMGEYPFGGYASYWPEFLKHKQERVMSQDWSKRQLESR